MSNVEVSGLPGLPGVGGVGEDYGAWLQDLLAAQGLQTEEVIAGTIFNVISPEGIYMFTVSATVTP